MKETVVYVVMAIVEYELAHPIGVFRWASDAAEYAAKCNEYESARPLLPDDATDSDYDLEYEQFERWVKNHPAGEDHYGSCFSVLSVPFSDLSAPGAELLHPFG